MRLNSLCSSPGGYLVNRSCKTNLVCSENCKDVTFSSFFIGAWFFLLLYTDKQRRSPKLYQYKQQRSLSVVSLSKNNSYKTIERRHSIIFPKLQEKQKHLKNLRKDNHVSIWCNYFICLLIGRIFQLHSQFFPFQPSRDIYRANTPEARILVRCILGFYSAACIFISSNTDIFVVMCHLHYCLLVRITSNSIFIDSFQP